MASVRLQRYLAAAGVAARRKAEQLITDGRVTVNGKVVRVLGTKVDPDSDRVQVDGDGLPPEPPGPGEAGRPPRLLQRRRPPPHERRRARRTPARPREPRAEDV